MNKKLHYIMNDKITDLFGWITTGSALSINLQAWIEGIEFNRLLTFVISILSLVFLFMKMYDQYLVTKKRKEEIALEEKSKSNGVK